ncbi:MAG: TSCPD domain-containing protein, partial [Lachnospiraceae bacterium]|nr:TSCPD domain-containing protein [Lachnospiraceae bacterium]
MEFRPSGVCSKLIKVDVDGDVVKNVEFVGGC